MPAVTIGPAEVVQAKDINTLVAYSRADSYLSPEHGIGEEWRTRVLGRMLRNEAVQKREDAILAAQLDPSHHLYLAAVDAERVVGMLRAFKLDKKYELDSLFVAADRRGQRIGAMFMDAYFAWATESLPTELEVVEYNEGAIRFYERHGFATVAGSAAIIEHIPKIVMRREATPKEEPK